MLKDIYDENNNDIIKDEKEIEKTISKLQNDPNAKYNRERLSLITNYLALKREINEMYNKLKLYINKNKKVEVSKLFTENSTFYEDMQKVSESLKSIKKSLKSITEIKQITGESSIEKIANNIMKDFTKIDDAIKVHNKLSSSKLKINMDNEEGNVKDLIAKKNPMFNKFVEKIKNIIENHKTNNEKLLDVIKNFYFNKDKNNEFLKFSNNVITELINNDGIKNFNKEDNKKILNTGFNYINKNDSTKPQYEIYASIDLFEGEVNESNLNTCNFRDYYLGQEAENFSKKSSAYDNNYHKLFVPLKNNIEGKENPNKQSKVGGFFNYTSKKRKNGNKKSYNRNNRKRMSRFNRKCIYH